MPSSITFLKLDGEGNGYTHFTSYDDSEDANVDQGPTLELDVPTSLLETIGYASDLGVVSVAIVMPEQQEPDEWVWGPDDDDAPLPTSEGSALSQGLINAGEGKSLNAAGNVVTHKNEDPIYLGDDDDN